MLIDAAVGARKSNDDAVGARIAAGTKDSPPCGFLLRVAVMIQRV